MTPGWLQGLLDDPAITDICINGSRQTFVDRGRGMEEAENETWTEDNLRLWVFDQLGQIGKSWDARNPFVDATLSSGHRAHIVFPPAARNGLMVSLRRLPRPAASNEGFIRWGNSPLFGTLRAAVERGDSVLISGATGSGKTTLATDLLSLLPARERIVALEDTPELAPCHPHFISLVSRPANSDGCGEITLRNLLKQTLRMRPDRIVLGECRGPEVLELLQALNTGHRGAMATLHAHSPREALRRIELLCLLSAGPNLSLGAIRELLALGVQWVAQVERAGAVRSIRELWKIEGREGETLLMRRV